MNLLREIYQDSKFASSWKEILGSVGFMTPEMTTINYKVGQPMGSYSS